MTIDAYAPSTTPTPDAPDRYEVVADHLAHSAVATAMLASGLRRQIETEGLTKETAVAALDAIIDEAIAAHQLAATVFND